MDLGGATRSTQHAIGLFCAKGSPRPGRQFERTFSDDLRAGVGAGRPNRQGGGNLFVPNLQEPHFKGACRKRAIFVTPDAPGATPCSGAI